MYFFLVLICHSFDRKQQMVPPIHKKKQVTVEFPPFEGTKLTCRLVVGTRPKVKGNVWEASACSANWWQGSS
jgi:hypothetical protein